jgi:hypothetical protein
LLFQFLFYYWIYSAIQERLISTGKFYDGEAVLMIKHVEKTGKIEKIVDCNVYRIVKSVATKEEGEEWSNIL